MTQSKSKNVFNFVATGRRLRSALALIAGLLVASTLSADPCGMVPPIYTGNQSPITRIGLQKTYVFHKDGVETFVIRPGFSGNVDTFGMLIPFPNPPELRKVADNTFEQIANAVDPPEVVVDLRMPRGGFGGGVMMPMSAAADSAMNFRSKSESIKVLKQEAVGMYEVAVLEAGSAEVLKKWMDKNGYQYPKGMDKVTNDYVELGWCFVAVKTKVGQKAGVDPKPGQRRVKPELPSGSVFDGNVQGMGFRFKSDHLVVPMRLSAFNEGELRNVVYLLTDSPKKIRSIPEEYVVRQISGQQLIDNVSNPLPLRIIGGTEKDIPDFQRKTLPKRRDPSPKNGVARDLFAADLLAVATGNLSLQHEEEEKELLRIGEHFGLRGAAMDKENSEALADARKNTTGKALAMLKGMTLTVVDGDFPREVIARDNLTFADYKMPGSRNNNKSYDANLFGPGKEKQGVLKFGAIDWSDVDRQIVRQQRHYRFGLYSMIGLGMLGMFGTLAYRKPSAATRTLVFVTVAVGVLAGSAMAGEPGTLNNDLIEKLENSQTAGAAIDSIVSMAKDSQANRDKMIKDLLAVFRTDQSLSKRGWAIAALAAIGGQDVDEYLLNLHADENQKRVVRTWAAAARVSNTKTVNGLIEKANLIQKFPALGRPIGMRIVEKMTSDAESADPEKVMAVTQKVPQLQTALAPMIMAFGPEKLGAVMLSAKDQNVRRIAAGYMGSVAQGGTADEVVKVVNSQLNFDSTATAVPWDNGPLFVPGIQWSKEDATGLVGNLIRWNLWCDINGKKQQQRQIHNNIRSLGLAQAAGYQSPGWNNSDCTSWLKAWGAVVGKAGIEKILSEQNVLGTGKYDSALDGLK